jgi:hypothetical protein
MSQIYKYQPQVEPGANGTVIRYQNTENEDITYLGDLDGWSYVSAPNDTTIPDQPNEINWQQVTSKEKKEKLRQKLRTFQNSRNLADAQIKTEVGDHSDLMADLAKRIGMVERLVMRIAYFLLSGQEISQEVKDAYYPLVESYIQAVDGGLVEDRVDLESNVRLQEVLTQRFDKIAQIVDDVHLRRVRDMLG